jgi:putative ABC transport system permease protein
VRRRATPRQIVLEGLAVTLAIAGVLALRSRGLTTESAVQGSDPFLAVVPVLLGFAAGLLTLRGYPYPLRLISRLTARGRSAVPFIGVARAARQGLLAALPVIVLLLATAIAGFAGVVDSELHRAQQRSAWLTAGADARIDGQRLDRAALERVRRVPGVRDAVPARIIDSVTFGSPSQNVPVTLVAIDLAGYRRLVAGSPIRLPTPPRDGLVPPALLSPGLAQQIGRGPFRLSAAVISDLTVRPADTIDAFPTTSGAFVVVPDRPLSASEQPTAFFVRGTRLDSAQLHRAAGGDTVVTTRAGSYDALTGAPMVGLVRAAFGYGTLVVAGYGTLAILLTLIIGSSARGQTMSYLRTLGLSRSQAHRLAIVELGPVLLCAAIVGWAVGLLLPHVIGPAMDLRPYTGGLPATGYGPDPLMTMALAIGLIVFGGLAIAADTMISGRRQLGAELRMGAQS